MLKRNERGNEYIIAKSLTDNGTRATGTYCRHSGPLANVRLQVETVAVGTILTDRPLRRSVRARLRIRLLRRMSGVKACFRIRMQNAGWWNPPFQDGSNAVPPDLSALTAANQNISPQTVDAMFEEV